MTDFEAMYRKDADPWKVATCWYERRKRAVLMASLPGDRYHCALELGCGIGETTHRLAAICERVHAVDLSATAVQRCRQRLSDEEATRVCIEVLRLPEDWPSVTHGSVDLLVVAELAYYFSDAELGAFLERCSVSLAPLGDWVMCHYKADFHDRRQSTESLHQRVDQLAGLRPIVCHDDERFRLDIWRKTGQSQA
ncbi:MAG: SAM-dependent methyltransferase [Burkholderiaceae bacterium]